jgi:hypothetical protein
MLERKGSRPGDNGAKVRPFPWARAAGFALALLTVVGSAAKTINTVDNAMVVQQERQIELEADVDILNADFKEHCASTSHKVLSEFFMPRPEINVHLSSIDDKLERLLNK